MEMFYKLEYFNQLPLVKENAATVWKESKNLREHCEFVWILVA